MIPTIKVNLNLQMYGMALVALSGILYGLIGFLGTKLFQENFSVATMLFWRFFIATVWMAIAIICSCKQFTNAQTPILGSIKTISLVSFFYAIGSALFFFATKEIGTGPAMVIFFSFPVFVALFSWKINAWQIDKSALGAVILVIIGLFMLKAQGEHALNIWGVIISLCAAFAYACYVLSSQQSTRLMDSLLLTFFICLGNTFIFLFIATWTHTLILPHTFTAWFYICTLGILATVLPIKLMLDGLKYISPVKASILSVLEPVVTVILGIAWLQESLSSLQLFGIATILLGALLIQFEKA